MLDYQLPNRLERLFDEALRHGEKRSYLNVQEALLEEEDYSPFSTELIEANCLIKEGRLLDAKKVLQEGLALNLLLSPSAHLTMSYISGQLFDEKNKNLEREISRVLLYCILSTGRGTLDSPYCIARTTDEYDALQQRRLILKEQSFQQKGGRYYDVMLCTNHKRIYFDITAIYGCQELCLENN